jgi:hypothetical protein
MVSVNGIKINARRCSYPGTSKQVFAKAKAIVSQILDARVDIKRAVGRGYGVDTKLRQGGQQERSIFGIGCDIVP